MGPSIIGGEVFNLPVCQTIINIYLGKIYQTKKEVWWILFLRRSAVKSNIYILWKFSVYILLKKLHNTRSSNFYLLPPLRGCNLINDAFPPIVNFSSEKQQYPDNTTKDILTMFGKIFPRINFRGGLGGSVCLSIPCYEFSGLFFCGCVCSLGGL